MGKRRVGQRAKRRYESRNSHSLFALELTEMPASEGIEILFDTPMSQPVLDGGIRTELAADGKNGRRFFSARMVMDATGDADVLRRAGEPTVQGKIMSPASVLQPTWRGMKGGCIRAD